MGAPGDRGHGRGAEEEIDAYVDLLKREDGGRRS